MRIGVPLPQFRHDADTAIAHARRAEELGLDGVFVYDHLHPLGAPERPVLHGVPLLGALAAETSRVAVGTLVLRVGLVPDAVRVHELETAHRMLGDRLIAGLGAGDGHSRAENRAFGVRFGSLDERLESLAACTRAVQALGITAWVGGLSPMVRSIAVETQAPLNLWAVTPDVVEAVGDVEATWGGSVTGDAHQVADQLRALADAGATWAICGPPVMLETVSEAAALVR